ncbi:hypothetical protein GCM10009554_06980 [Kribbella koreensis]|uniref:Uncharacterized protein n=1 Tax=Kribbella koreensis TaxID=57909 RepID=A0ABP3ZSL4_9ACTN
MPAPLRPTSPDRTGPATKVSPSNSTPPSGQAKERSVQVKEKDMGCSEISNETAHRSVAINRY